MKRWIARLAVNNPENYLQNPPKWVKWVHNPTGLVHCVTCLKLNGCWFIDNNRPECPKHPSCHCFLEIISYD